MGGKAKKVVTNPKAIAGAIAAPVTGGASLALTKSAYDDEAKKAKKEEVEKAAKREAVLEQKREAAETEERKKNKLANISARGQQTSGLASLIGSGSDTLG